MTKFNECDGIEVFKDSDYDFDPSFLFREYRESKYEDELKLAMSSPMPCTYSSMDTECKNSHVIKIVIPVTLIQKLVAKKNKLCPDLSLREYMVKKLEESHSSDMKQNANTDQPYQP